MHIPIVMFSLTLNDERIIKNLCVIIDVSAVLFTTGNALTVY
jgi:hypothetical protein